jgi:hypothetical protein
MATKEIVNRAARTGGTLFFGQRLRLSASDGVAANKRVARKIGGHRNIRTAGRSSRSLDRRRRQTLAEEQRKSGAVEEEVAARNCKWARARGTDQ